jgi:hypothetical protein
MTCKPDYPIKHRHHIMPRYRGGSDDPSNLVEVSVVQHAMWHFCNYQLWGDDRDKLAFLALSGKIGKEEIGLERSKIGARIGSQRFLKMLEDPDFRSMFSQKIKEKYNDPLYKKKNEEHLRSIQSMAIKAANTPDSLSKKIETFKRIGHQKGKKNSQYGTRWIHNLELRVSSRVKKDCPLPDGWNEGRVMDFDKKLNPAPKAVREKPRLGIPRDWTHDVYGVVLDTTSSELCERFKEQKLNRGALSQVACGKNKKHKGWRIFDNNNNTRG